ncbi:MAG: dTMP kinase [Chloroflexi bacterium]|nr:dTMP kinase [Chloroflexota bacterium]
MFITFEGSEGSGKTTQITLLADFLRQRGLSVVVTREPGGTPIAEQVRQVLHDVQNTAMTAEAEILLYAASRAQHVGELIRPALAQGQWVLCDRFADSTLAYQGYGRGLDLAALRQITQFATGGLQPQRTFYFDIDVQTGLERRVAGELEMNRMDLQQQAFYERVRAGYNELIAAEPNRWVRLNAARPIADIQTELQQLVMSNE